MYHIRQQLQAPGFKINKIMRTNINVYILTTYLLEFDLDVPDRLLCLGDPSAERLLHPVGLLPQILARPRQRVGDEAAQPLARLPLLVRPPQVDLAEVAPLHGVGLTVGSNEIKVYRNNTGTAI